jgi:hypothetical protein
MKIWISLFFILAASLIASCGDPTAYYHECGYICVHCIPGKCEFTAIATNKTRQLDTIEMRPGEEKKLYVCSGDVVHLNAFWGSDIGQGNFIVPTYLPINSTVAVSGTIQNTFYQVFPNSCY